MYRPEAASPARRAGRARTWSWLASLSLLAALAGCASMGAEEHASPRIPEPIRAPKAEPAPEDAPGEQTLEAPEEEAKAAGEGAREGAGEAARGPEQRPRAERTPRAPMDPALVVRPQETPLPLEGEATTLNVDGLPLPAFINEVFGNLLGLDFQISPELREREDRVTLRISRPQSPEAVFQTANEVLRTYGVAIVRREELLHFVRAEQAGEQEQPPLLSTGRALPSVPAANRPVFHVIPLEVVSNASARSWLQKAFEGTELTVEESPTRTAIILRGPAGVVRQAARAARLFDQPHMRGRHGLRLNPRFRDPESLASDLVKLLEAEGYAAGNRPTARTVIVLPMTGVGAVFVFATSERVLEHVREWARTLDQPGRTSTDGKGIFYYPVENTGASALAEVVGRILGATGTGGAQQQQGQPEQGTGGPQGDRRDSGPGLRGSGTRQVSFAGGALVVDRVGNALIFNGEPETWARLRPLIQRMDRPVPQVLIEVTVAEITLTDQRDLGVEGLLRDIDLGDLSGRVSTQGGLGLGAGGLTATLDDPGDGQLVLNAFRTHDRVKILSRPHLMVKSGEEASIDVGTEVPVITSQASSSEFQLQGDSAILQEVQFRETGVILEILPIVRGNRTVDVLVHQEVSEAQPTQTSDINSPSIFRRAVDTSLTLRDGTPVLMGGLISEDRSTGRSGVPGLQRIPGLGRLFRVDSESSTRTELMVLMTPYILRTHDEAAEITREFERALSETRNALGGGGSESGGGSEGGSTGASGERSEESAAQGE